MCNLGEMWKMSVHCQYSSIRGNKAALAHLPNTILQPVGVSTESRAQRASEHTPRTPGALLSHITQHPPAQIALLTHYGVRLSNERAALNHKALI